MEFSEPFELESILSHEKPLGRRLCSVDMNLSSEDLGRFLKYVDNLEDGLDMTPQSDISSFISNTNSEYSRARAKDSFFQASNRKKSLQERDSPEMNELEVTRDESYTPPITQKIVSCLTRSLQKENVYRYHNSDSKEVTVFLFCTQNHIKISVHRSYTIDQLITKALNAFVSSNLYTQMPLRNGPKLEGYEVWFVEDAGYMPETDFKLNRNMKVSDLVVDSLALCEAENLRPYKGASIPIRKFSQISKGIPLKICFETRWTIITASPDSKLICLFPSLQKKFPEVGYLYPQEYEFRINFNLDDELLHEECSLDHNITVESLSTKQLKLCRKTFVDSSVVTVDVSLARAEKECIYMDEGKVLDAYKCNLTKTQAYAYKEYDVIKRNSRGKKQKRLLGIDQFCLYNLSKAQTQQELGNIETRNRGMLRNKIKNLFYSVTQKTEIPISKVCRAYQLENHLKCFEIEFKNAGETKNKLYEASSSTIAGEIVAKISKLILIGTKSIKDSKKINS